MYGLEAEWWLVESLVSGRLAWGRVVELGKAAELGTVVAQGTVAELAAAEEEPSTLHCRAGLEGTLRAETEDQSTAGEHLRHCADVH